MGGSDLSPHFTPRASSGIYFCDDVRPAPLLSRRDLPRAKRDAIQALHTREPRRNARLLFVVALLAAAVAVSVTTRSILVWTAVGIVTALAFVSLSVVMHEAAHGLAFQSRRLNRWVGFACGLPLLVAVSAYRTVHLRHHVHERSEGDPDDPEGAPRRGAPLTLWYYVCLLLGSYLYIPHIAATSLRLARGRARADILLEYTLILACFVLALRLLPLALWVRLWLCPFIIAAQLSSLKGIAEHGLTTGGNPFTASRSIHSNALVRFVLWNSNYHLEHHLFPGVPWYNLPKLHGLLEAEYREAGASIYPSYVAFLGDFVRASRAGLVLNARLLPRELREQLCG